MTVLFPVPGVLMIPAEGVTPDGIPVTVIMTAELKLFVPTIAAVAEPLDPGVTLIEDGLRLSEKLGGGSTVRVRGAVLVTPPPVALTVSA